MSNNGLNVVRVLFQNIESGDRRKFEAKSNDSDTGGGARDLRFRPEINFWPFFRNMFPQKRLQNRKSGNSVKQIEILSGTVTWNENGVEKSAEMEVWPSTNARPNECRIAKISSFGLFDLIEDDPNDGRSIFMMFQQQDGAIRVHFTTETSLRNDNWDPIVKSFAEDWMREGSKAAFLDLTSKERYPHG